MRPTPLNALSVRDQLAGRRVLLTGVTGFLGKVWAAQILMDLPEIGRITVLARGRRGEHPVERVERLLGTSPALRPLRARHGAGLASFLADKIDVLPGDVGEPLAGVRPDALARLEGQIDLVLHFAGLTDFQPDPLAALAANTHGALHVADLAVALGAPMLHVSTAYVAGRRDGEIEEELDPTLSPLGARFDPAEALATLEQELAEIGHDQAQRRERIERAQAHADRLGWPNLYTFSKALGERLLAQREGLNLTIARPSIVECARTSPFAGWNEGVNTSAPLAWLISTPFRDFPSRAHHHFDIAPVDLVSRGITLIAADILAGRGGGVFHLGTSGSNPVSYGRIIELTGLANRRRLRESSDVAAWERLLVPHLDPVAVDADHKPLWHVGRLRKGLDRARKALERADEKRLPPALRETAGSTLKTLRRKGIRTTAETARLLRRIETMLELFQPFVHDHDYIFCNDRVRALSASLPESEREPFAFDADTIDWRDYWYNVQYPGLWVWSIPLLRGERVPLDALPEPPLRLSRAAAPELAVAGSQS